MSTQGVVIHLTQKTNIAKVIKNPQSKNKGGVPIENIVKPTFQKYFNIYCLNDTYINTIKIKNPPKIEGSFFMLI